MHWNIWNLKYFKFEILQVWIIWKFEILQVWIFWKFEILQVWTISSLKYFKFELFQVWNIWILKYFKFNVPFLSYPSINLSGISKCRCDTICAPKANFSGFYAKYSDGIRPPQRSINGLRSNRAAVLCGDLPCTPRGARLGLRRIRSSQALSPVWFLRVSTHT